jgi:hypothetical protein
MLYYHIWCWFLDNFYLRNHKSFDRWMSLVFFPEFFLFVKKQYENWYVCMNTWIHLGMMFIIAVNRHVRIKIYQEFYHGIICLQKIYLPLRKTLKFIPSHILANSYLVTHEHRTLNNYSSIGTFLSSHISEHKSYNKSVGIPNRYFSMEFNWAVP